LGKEGNEEYIQNKHQARMLTCSGKKGGNETRRENERVDAKGKQESRCNERPKREKRKRHGMHDVE
jgi:hypothetical protein